VNLLNSGVGDAGQDHTGQHQMIGAVRTVPLIVGGNGSLRLASSGLALGRRSHFARLIGYDGGMSFEATLNLAGWDGGYTLIVEPWASEFEVAKNDKCELVAFNAEKQPVWWVSIADGKLIAWMNEHGTTFEFWRSDQLELRMPVAIPHPPKDSQN
jgi:hypothetical protein